MSNIHVKTYEGYLDNFYGNEYTSTFSKNVNIPGNEKESEIKRNPNIETYHDRDGNIKYKKMSDSRTMANELYECIKDNDLVELEKLLKEYPNQIVNVSIHMITLLIFACKIANLDAVKLLVKYEADINLKGGGLYNPLCTLAQLPDKTIKHIEILRYLLDLPDIDIEYKTKHGTPLLIAISKLKSPKVNDVLFDPTLYLETINILLEYGANPYATKITEYTYDNKKRTIDAFELALSTDPHNYSTKYNKEILDILEQYYSKDLKKYNI